MQQLTEHVPAGAVLECVRVVAGPMRGIEPLAMQWAWESLRQESLYPDAELHLQVTPWQLHCTACNAEYESNTWDGPCSCGSGPSYPVGGDELYLDSLEIADPAAEQAAAGS